MTWYPFRRRRIRLDPDLLERAAARVREAGYADLEEFVSHCVEKELRRRPAEDEARLKDRLRGLGYLDP